MSRARSFRVRYTLRALLVFITLFMLWGGYHTNRSWKERAAEKTLHAHSSFWYGPRRTDSDFFNAVAFGYQRVVQTVWRERYITGVSVFSHLQPDVVNALGSLPHLEMVELCRPGLPVSELEAKPQAWNRPPRLPMPPGVLVEILKQDSIRTLRINGYAFSDSDCQAIGAHSSLENLTLVDCALTNENLARLLVLPRLRWIALAMCDIGGDELATLPGSPTLEGIACRLTPLTSGLGLFAARCPHLKTLEVSHESIDDEFVAALGMHSSLGELYLNNSAITDKSIESLKTMPSLKIVALPRKTVSQQAATNFKQARPGIMIIH